MGGSTFYYGDASRYDASVSRAPAVLSRCRAISLRAAPCDVLRLWPETEPVVALISGGGGPNARWSILASPLRFEQLRLGHSHQNARSDLHTLLSTATNNDHERRGDQTDLPPFRGGRIGFIGYECGGLFEKRAAPAQRHAAASWPDAAFAWCPSALVHDSTLDQWWVVGADLDTTESFANDIGRSLSHPAPNSNSWHAGELSSCRSDGWFARACQRTIELIGQGDLFQANISEQFACDFSGDTRAFAAQALASAPIRYGSYLELPEGNRIISFSPELFLSFDVSSRLVTTRPIKGTRAAAGASCSDAAAFDAGMTQALLESEKDAAELNMIIDLMRNDLGRVCETGTVRVARSRHIERHGTVLHAVAEVSGTLAESCGITDLIGACFPPGSVTGAPKVRAMQIIDDIESVPRGVYCGIIGFIDTEGSLEFSVAIRTAMLTATPTAKGAPPPFSGRLHYCAGCGIVADSDPRAETQERLDKTAVLREALRTSPQATPRESPPPGSPVRCAQSSPA